MIGRFEKFTLALSELTASWNKIATDELKGYGLKGGYVVYLIALFKEEEGLCAAKLCEICNRDKAEVSRAIRTMEERGIVVKDDSGNGYRAKIKLTDEGREITRALRERIKLVVEKAGSGLDDEMREAFYTALGVISENLKQITKKGL